MSNLVLAVVSNYRRPENVEPICRRLLEDGGCDVIVADNAPSSDLEFCAARTDFPILDVWRWRINSGPPARWWPALAWTHKYRYVALVDDDHMPSRGLVAALVAQAESLGDRFAVIGRVGRNFRHRRGRWQYRRRNVKWGQVDMAGAGYFVVSERLLAAVRLRDELARAGAHPDMLWHDDMLLNCSIQRDYGYPSWMPTQPWAERAMDTRGYAFNATDRKSVV